MPYQKALDWIVKGLKDLIPKGITGMTVSAEELEEKKKKKKKGLQPHGRWQMSDEEFEKAEEASK